MEVVIQSDEPAKSVSGAEEAIGRHNQHKVRYHIAGIFGVVTHLYLLLLLLL